MYREKYRYNCVSPINPSVYQFRRDINECIQQRKEDFAEIFKKLVALTTMLNKI